MDNEHEDNDGTDDARRSGRDKDSGDKARGVQVANPSEIGLGTPDCGMEQGRADAPQVDGTGEGAQQVAFQWRSAPLPTVDEFAGYEQIQPGAADRIIAMAEKSLDAEIEAQRKANEVAANAPNANQGKKTDKTRDVRFMNEAEDPGARGHAGAGVSFVGNQNGYKAL